MRRVIVDIWGGYRSQDHLARFIRDIPEALIIAHTELEKGFLVNLRVDASFGDEEDWDMRVKQ